MFTKTIKNRALSRLGAPTIDVEIGEEALMHLWYTAQGDWNLYSKLSKIDKSTLNKIEQEWTENYFLALCKESLGRIREKFKGALPVPGEEISLEYKSLLSESEKEKGNLINLLVPYSNKIILVVYVNVGNINNDDVDHHIKKIRETIITADRGINFFFIAVREQESRIECIYPQCSNNEEIISKLNICLDDVIKNIKNEQ